MSSTNNNSSKPLKKKYLTTIVVESSYDPEVENIGPISLLMDASTGSGTTKIINVKTVEDETASGGD